MSEERTQVLEKIRSCNLTLDESEHATISPEDSRRLIIRSKCGKVIAVVRVLKGAEIQAGRALRNGVVDSLLGG